MPKGPSMRVATVWMLIARQKRAERIVELHDAGFSQQEIADLVGCSRWLVRGIYAKEKQYLDEAALRLKQDS